MSVPARLVVLMLVLTGLVISPAAARPREDKGNERSNRAQSQASPTPSPSATTSPTPSASPSGSPSSPPGGSGGSGGSDPAGPLPMLTLESSASELLVEVGGTFRYTVRVRNNSDEALEGVSVVDEVAPEVDVVAVPVPDDVEAVQLGQSPTREDIVWNVGRMEPGQEVTLEWTARAASAGDLIAVNEVTAEAEDVPSRSLRSTTFLASDEGVRVATNPPAPPVTKKVVVLGTRLVPAPSSTGAVLPVTGMEVVPYLAGAFLLIAMGLLLYSAARYRSSRVAAGVIVAVLLLSACVDAGPEEHAADPAPEESVEQETEVDPKPTDRVLGTRFTRSPQEAAEDQAETVDTGAPTEGVEVAAPEFVEEQFREVRAVVLDPEDTAVPLDSREGDNAMTFDWDLDTRSMPLATSGVRFFPEETIEIMTTLRVEDDAIKVVVTLYNAGDVPVDVDGNLVHVVSGADGEIADFTSEPIDMVLNPGGEVNAEFSYLVPTGRYFVSSAFDAD